MKFIEFLVNESIYDMDPEAPTDPEVLVQGVGRYKLSQVKDNVRRKLADIGKMAESEDSPEMWQQVQWKISHGAMREMIKAIIDAEEELKSKIH